MFNKQDPMRNAMMLSGPLSIKGYDWWWHSFTAVSEETGEEKSFFIEYYLCNPFLARQQPTFGQLPKNKENGIRPSYLMVKAGTWGKDHCQVHRFFPWGQVKLNRKAPYRIEADDCLACDTQLKGSVAVAAEDAKAHPEWMSDAGEITWDLTVDKQIAFNVGYGAGSLFRFIKAFEMYWHAEGMKTAYTGTITCNGVCYTVKPETCCGYADKNWGSDFTSPWLWLSSCDLYSMTNRKKLTNSVLDIGGGKPRVFGLPLNRILLGAFYYEGKEYEFNFSKLWTGSKTQFTCTDTRDEIRWHVVLSNRTAEMQVDVACPKRDMLLINYEAPDGSKRHNHLWNGGTGTGRIQLFEKQGKEKKLVDDIKAGHIGCEYGEYDKMKKRK